MDIERLELGETIMVDMLPGFEPCAICRELNTTRRWRGDPFCQSCWDIFGFEEDDDAISTEYKKGS